MNTWFPSEDTEGAHVAASYDEHSDTLRGRVRHALVDRALQHRLPPPAPVGEDGLGGVLDIGGGTGRQAQLLARRGYHVTVLDPDEEMLERGRAAWARESGDAPGSVDFVLGSGEATAGMRAGSWDAVLCHGVLMYLEDPEPLVDAITRWVRPGGVVSLLAKSSEALAMRRGLRRDWDGVLHALRDTAEQGNLGLVSRGLDRNQLVIQLAQRNVVLEAWYGVRIFTDHLGQEKAGPDFPQVLEAEWEAGRVDPYRRLARLFHLIARHEGPEQGPGAGE